MKDVPFLTLKTIAMSNMSYCEFENTYNDLQQCHESLASKSLDELSPSEKKYAQKLIKLCEDIAADFSENNQ